MQHMRYDKPGPVERDWSDAISGIEEIIEESTVEHDWRALAWLLERRLSKRWGRREYLESTVTEKPIEEMTDNEIDAELSEILEKCNEE